MIRSGKGKMGLASIHSLSFSIFKKKSKRKSYHGTPVNNYRILKNYLLFALYERAGFECPKLKSLRNPITDAMTLVKWDLSTNWISSHFIQV